MPGHEAEADLATCLVDDRPEPVRAGPEEVVLDVLRSREHITGVKDGCHEGDCGACTVLVGEARGTGVSYASACSCLLPFADVHGRHVVTVAGLRLADGLTTVQRALVEEGAVQCGFCTPGLVVALTGHLVEPHRRGDLDAALAAVEGNLCRCTGHVAVVRAVRRLVAEEVAAEEAAGGEVAAAEVGAPPDALVPGGRSAPDDDELRRLVARGVLPGYLAVVPARLRALADAVGALAPPPPGAGAPVVAGGTDTYVDTGGHVGARPSAPGTRSARRHLLGRSRPEGEAVTRVGASLVVPATTTVEALRRDPVLREDWPALAAALELFGSQQVRHRATVGGNLAGGSPVADLACLLAPLGVVRLAGPDGQREVPLPDFWTGHHATALRPGEIVEAVVLPRAAPGTRLVFERSSRRRHLDVATVSVAVLAHAAGDVLSGVRVAAGGVGPTVCTLPGAAARLEGRLDAARLASVLALAPTEVAPVDDVRGSAAYRRLLVRQLLAAALDGLVPAVLTPELLP
jgi:xanthine dehydrogenase small subunit